MKTAAITPDMTETERFDDDIIAPIAPHVQTIAGRHVAMMPATNMMAGTASGPGGGQVCVVTMVAANHRNGLCFPLGPDSARGFAAHLIAVADELDAAAAGLANTVLAKAAGK